MAHNMLKCCLKTLTGYLLGQDAGWEVLEIMMKQIIPGLEEPKSYTKGGEVQEEL